MKVLRGTLTFVLGMILGVILFFVALAGAIYGVTSAVKIGKIEQVVGQNIFDENSIQDQTLFETGWELFQDIKSGIMNMSLNELSTKYGVKSKIEQYKELEGIDLSPLFNHPLNDMSAAVDEVIKGITLNDVGELAGIDFSSYNLPVLDDNLYVGVTTALDNILKSVNGNLTLRAIEEQFGISFGENALFDQIKDAPLSTFGDFINAIKLGTLLDTDEDLFVLNGVNNVFVKVDKYEEVATADFDKIADGAKTYASNVVDGKIVTKELRFAVKQVVGEDGEKHPATDELGNTVYVVDNSSNKEDFEYDGETKYYRFVEYEPYKLGQTYPSGTEFAVRAYTNHYDENSGTSAKLTQNGFVSLSEIFADSSLSTPLKATAKTITINSSVYYKDGVGSAQAETYGFDPEKFFGESLKAEKGFDETYLLIHKGSADMAIQSIANSTIKELNNATDNLLNVKLEELITIDETSSIVVQSLRHATLNNMSAAVDNLVLGDIVEINASAFVKSATGTYVYVENESVYRPYNKATDAGVKRYTATFAPATDGKYVCIDGTYYLYETENADMAGMQRYAASNFVEDANGFFVMEKKCGYYTAYNPAAHNATNVLSEGGNVVLFKKYVDSENHDYAQATTHQLTDGTALYYYDEATDTMISCDRTHEGTLFVKQSGASKALQRLKNIRLKACAEEFKELMLGDVLDIDGDDFSLATPSFSEAVDTTDTSISYFVLVSGNYEIADRAYITAHPADIYYVFDGTTKYYYYDDGVYFEATPEYIGTHRTETYYIATRSGASHVILKKLIYLKIDDLSTKIDKIIDDLYLKDLIDINEFAVVRQSSADVDDSNARWIVEYDPTLDETLAGKTYHYVYTYDSNGKYYVSDTNYKPLLTSDMTEAGDITFDYQLLYSGGDRASAFAALALHATNLYFKDAGGNYHFNIAYCTYLFNKEQYSDVYYRTTGTGSYSGKAYSYGGSTADLYVNILGTYVPYNPTTNPEQLGLDVYLKETGGNYFVRLDAEFNAMKEHGTAPVTYSKQLCDEIYVENNSGDYAYIDGEYVLFSTLTSEQQASVTVRYDKVIGYLATLSEVALGTSAPYSSWLTDKDNLVEIVKDKSACVLSAFASHNTKISTIDTTIKSFTLEDLMEISPDSMFDDDEIKTAQIEDLAIIMQNKLQTITIKDITGWGNITTLNPQLVSIVGDSTLEDFFRALSYDATTGNITVDMTKLYNY